MPVEVLIPPLAATTDTLRLVEWYRQEGETVTKDEPLFAVETDKATLDVEAPASGILRHVSAQPGAEVEALSRIAIIAAPGEAWESGSSRLQAPGSRPDKDSAFFPQPGAWSLEPGAASRASPPSRSFISPRARRLAESRDVAWRTLRGTGPEGAIVERDVLAALQPQQDEAAGAGEERFDRDSGQRRGPDPGRFGVSRVPASRRDVGRVPASRRDAGHSEPAEKGAEAAEKGAERQRRAPGPGARGREVLETIQVAGARAVTAARMLQSATTTAPVTLTTETDATELVALRARQRAAGVPCSYNDLLLWLLARALREHPRLNASLQGDEIRVWRQVNIGLAVDSEHGLRVPVVRDVDRKGLAEIARETAALVEAARQGRSTPEAQRGGTFTLTNLGMFGIDAFTPILNLPECAVLGVGRIRPQPAVVDERLAIRQKMWLSLTFDHRLVDGAHAARFLQRVAQLIEKPPEG